MILRNDADRPGDPNTIYQYTYDNFDRIVSYNDSNFIINYDYRASDSQKSRITVALAQDTNQIIYDVNYSYDLFGQMQDVFSPDDDIASFGYDDNGRRTQLKYWLGTEGEIDDVNYAIDYSYDDRNNLIGITAGRPEGAPSYTFDANTIDGLGRLCSAAETITGIGVSGNTIDHQYIYGYDMRSQLVDANITNIGGQSPGYDLNGNLISDGSNYYCEYNWDNKLRSASGVGGSMSVKYDPLGNRICKDSTVNGNRRYIVDITGSLPTIICEIDPTDMSVKRSYIYANSQILMQDEPQSSQRYFYTHDRLGSVRLLINSDSSEFSVVNSYTYSPFGEALETSDEPPATGNCFRFTGQWFDSEIGQYYLRARQYDPALMRFTARDPVRGKSNRPLTLHPYLYCGNDPLNRIDPRGEDYVGTIGAAAMGVVLYAVEATVGYYALRYAGDMLLKRGALNNAISWIVGGLASGKDRVVDIGLSLYAMASRTWDDNPAASPGEGWEWVGKGEVGSGQGQWVNKDTGEKIHRDRDHGAPKGPHDGYTDENGDDWDIYPDGRVEPNPKK